MNKFDKQIRANRHAFDSQEPSPGHMERFSAKLKQRQTGSLLSRIPYAVKAAAAIVLVAVSSILIYEQARQYYQHQRISEFRGMADDFSEAESYYTSLIRNKYQEIDRLDMDDPKQKEMLMKELNDMDRLFHTLQKDFQANPNDERVINAMISHYQLKLEVMNQIIRQLEKVNQVNKTNHEGKDL
jgi:hypothetical protein